MSTQQVKVKMKMRPENAEMLPENYRCDNELKNVSPGHGVKTFHELFKSNKKECFEFKMRRLSIGV